jgi:hypothetical protein
MYHIRSTENYGTEVLIAFQAVRQHLLSQSGCIIQVMCKFCVGSKVFCSENVFHLYKV